LRVVTNISAKEKSGGKLYPPTVRSTRWLLAVKAEYAGPAGGKARFLLGSSNRAVRCCNRATHDKKESGPSAGPATAVPAFRC
jgi:hypothetical protein